MFELGKGPLEDWEASVEVAQQRSKIENEDDQLTSVKEAREWQERQKSGLFFAQNALFWRPYGAR
jgi:hypothetical protein